MLDYDFLKLSNSAIRAYHFCPVPALVCNRELDVQWSNQAAKTLFPAYTDSEGLQALLAEYPPPRLMERLQAEGGLTVASALPLVGLHVSFIPILDGARVEGAVLLLVDARLLPHARTPYLATKAAEAFSKSVRDSIGEIFGAMDTAAAKADFLQAGWIKTALNSINLENYRILRSVTNLVEYLKLQSGASPLRCRWLDLAELMGEYRGMLDTVAGEVGVPIRLETAGSPLWIYADRHLLEICFFNLLHNSLTYTRPGNRVTISLRGEGRTVFFTLRDRGAGIAPDSVRQVWRPYYSGGGHRPGLGLGLPLARAIIRAHRGDVELESRPGAGTRVEVRLPAATATQPVRLAQELVEPVSPDQRFSPFCIGLLELTDRKRYD